MESRLRSLGLLAVISPDTAYENGEVTVFSQGQCGSISDLVLGGREAAVGPVRELVKSSQPWLLDKMFYNGWVTPFQSLVGSAFQQLCDAFPILSAQCLYKSGDIQDPGLSYFTSAGGPRDSYRSGAHSRKHLIIFNSLRFKVPGV